MVLAPLCSFCFFFAVRFFKSHCKGTAIFGKKQGRIELFAHTVRFFDLNQLK